MSSWKVILAAIVIFSAGLATGGALMRKFAATPAVAKPEGEGKAPFMPWQVREEYVRRLNKELGLSPDQDNEIVRIIKESQERVKEIFESIGPQMKEEMTSVRTAIDAVLTPDQQKRYEELRNRKPTWKGMDERHRHRPPPGPDGQPSKEGGDRPPPPPPEGGVGNPPSNEPQ